MNTVQRNLFQNGAAWVRADFHLHTRADREFVYDGDDNYYNSSYVDALETAQIRIGVITNHNKFDKNEYDALRKTARGRGILLLPGVELSVNDGANGVHLLIVFGDQWLAHGHNHINPFLTTMFEGQTPQQYETANTKCVNSILQVVDHLDKAGKDYFLIFAHVEESKGLWHEFGCSRLRDMATSAYDSVRIHTLGFQKVRTVDTPDKPCRIKVQHELGDGYPAEVEGSDPKCIDEIGRSRCCYLKLGALTFDAVRYALSDHHNRVSSELSRYTHSHIRSIHFEGGTLSGQTIHLSPELNTLIGIRGSGKSSILEVLRYALEIPFGERASDLNYKEQLLGFAMGSGGKVIINAVDRNGQPYEIHRILNENHSTVYFHDKVLPGVSIRETVLHKPVYFGQKDLSKSGEGFEVDLVEKLLGEKLYEIRRKIADQKVRVGEAADRLLTVTNVNDQIDEQTRIKQDTEHNIKQYKDLGIEDRLQEKLDNDADTRRLQKGVGLVGDFVRALTDLLAQHEDDLRNYLGYTSKRNPEILKKFESAYHKVIQVVDEIKSGLHQAESVESELSAIHGELVTMIQELADQFAEIERKLSVELRECQFPNIRPDDFLKFNKKLVQTNQLLEALQKQSQQKADYEASLYLELQTLNDYWHQEFIIIKHELDRISSSNPSLNISVDYKGDQTAYLEFMKITFKGSGVREQTYKKLVDKYPDFVSMYADFDLAKGDFGTNPQLLADLFTKNLKPLLTYQTPSKFTIIYRDKPLQQHSLGQRASALILFVLSQNENDVIIIDQPEDDLDNQTIYEDVIKMIRQMKSHVQFIFATHNPNIPVLGDAEQILACSFDDEGIRIQSGGTDEPEQQKTIINIMEGGKEAFQRRKEIYQIWKP
ncbi:MAG: TrlF family AAA-like ATPase [Armatimonadota bacterium]